MVLATEKFYYFCGWLAHLQTGGAKRFDKTGHVFSPTEIESRKERFWKRN